jgi:hypothetical protein
VVVGLDRSTLLRSGSVGGLASGLVAAVDPASAVERAGVVAHDIDVPWNIRFLPGYDTPTALVSARDSGNLLLVSHRSVRKVGHFDVVSRPVVAESGCWASRSIRRTPPTGSSTPSSALIGTTGSSGSP